MREEIRHCMSDCRRLETGEIAARFCFPEGFTGFRGHFPGQPVLPGICTILAALTAVGAGRGMKLTLREVRSAKFFATSAPGEALDFTCTTSDEPEGGSRIRASVRSGDRKIAELQLVAASNGVKA
jgi:3-hydroxymyristoyl/3-hydroxydecanoyl-(acyl carrier protein) dehydratase